MRTQRLIDEDLTWILRLPPSPFKNGGAWIQDKSDMLAHFIQVVGQISRSSWMKSQPFTFTSQGDRVLRHSQLPIEGFVYAAVYFRQLFAKDKLFSEACRIYGEHAGNAPRVRRAKQELSAFEQSLDRHAFFFSELSLRDLINTFLYGALIIHGPKEVERKYRSQFQALMTRHPREELLYSLDLDMRNLCAHASVVATLIYGDMAEWQHAGYIPAPNVWWHSNLFPSSPHIEGHHS